jgi:hypothetical protein
MDGMSRDIDDLRLDIQTLRALIDLALDRGARGDDILLRACANVLEQRRRRLAELERVQLPGGETDVG